MGFSDVYRCGVDFLRGVCSKCFAIIVSFYRIFSLCFIESTATAKVAKRLWETPSLTVTHQPLHLQLHATASPACRQPFCEPGNQNRDEAAAAFSRWRTMFTVQTGTRQRNGPSAEGRSPRCRHRQHHLQKCGFSMLSIFHLAQQQPEDTAAAFAALYLLQGSKEGLSLFVCLWLAV